MMATSSAAAKLEEEIGAIRSRHSRRLTLRAAVALLDKLERKATSDAKAAEAETLATLPHPVHPSDLPPRPPRRGSGSPKGAALSPNAFDPTVPSQKSITNVMKALIGKVVELKKENAILADKLNNANEATKSTLQQVTNLNEQLTEAYSRVDALENELTGIRAQLAQHAEEVQRQAEIRKLTDSPSSPRMSTTRIRESGSSPKSISKPGQASFAFQGNGATRSSPLRSRPDLPPLPLPAKATSTLAMMASSGVEVIPTAVPADVDVSGIPDGAVLFMPEGPPLPPTGVPQPSSARSSDEPPANGLIGHVHAMAKQLQDSASHLRKERTARKAMTSAYQDLLQSHIRLLSMTQTNTEALAIALPDTELQASDELPLETVAAEVLRESDDTLPETTWLSPSSSHSGAEPPAGGKPTRAHPPRKQSALSAISLSASKTLPELSGLLYSVREHEASLLAASQPGNQRKSSLSLPADGDADTDGEGVEESEANKLIDVFGFEACTFQRLLDATQAALDVGSALQGPAGQRSTTSSELERAIARFRHIKDALPMSSVFGEAAPAATSEPKTNAVIIVHAAAKLISLLTAWDEYSRSPQHVDDPALKTAKAQLFQSTARALEFLKHALLRLSGELALALNIGIRLMASGATIASRSFDADGASPGAARGPKGSEDARMRQQIARAAQKAQLEWFAERLEAAATVPSWVISKELDVLSCARCNGAFSMMNRRHHCRCCGEVVCNACSLKYFALTSLGIGTAVRRRESDSKQEGALSRVCSACQPWVELVASTESLA